MNRSCLPKEERLCGAAQIRNLLKNGKKYSCSGAKLFILPNTLPYNRFVCTFRKHYGSAVQRNKARRLSKEIYRQTKFQLCFGYDIVLLLYPGFDEYTKRQRQINYLLKKAGLFSLVSEYNEV
ncbi:MAG: ribonuclease P protein component [Treponema sp.]